MLNALQIYRKYGQEDRAENMQDQQLADQRQQRDFSNQLSLVQMAQAQQARQQAAQQAAQQREQEMAWRREKMGGDTQLRREQMSINRERFAAAKAAAEERAKPKAPAGYRFTDQGSLEKIPGGPKDDTDKMKMRAQADETKSALVSQKVDEALNLVGPMTTGLTGDIRATMLGRVTGSGAYDLEGKLDTIKANIGFEELQAMRDASPTGGALGQVAVQELNMLQAVLGSLKQGQSEAELRKTLNDIKKHYERRQAMRWAYKNPNDPRTPAILEKLRMK